QALAIVVATHAGCSQRLARVGAARLVVAGVPRRTFEIAARAAAVSAVDRQRRAARRGGRAVETVLAIASAVDVVAAGLALREKFLARASAECGRADQRRQTRAVAEAGATEARALLADAAVGVHQRLVTEERRIAQRVAFVHCAGFAFLRVEP